MSSYTVPEPVHVELATADGLVEAEFTAGEHTPTTPGEALALEHLTRIGAAEPTKPRQRRSTKEA